MKTTLAFLLLLLLARPVNLQAQGVNPGSDDRLKLAALFVAVAHGGANVTILRQPLSVFHGPPR